jgi:signal transduction histidine kinase
MDEMRSSNQTLMGFINLMLEIRKNNVVLWCIQLIKRMRARNKSAFSLQFTLRHAEWALLLTVLLLYGIGEALYKMQDYPDLFLKASLFIFSFFLLSFIFPLNRPHWQRCFYVATEVILVLVAQLFWIELSLLLYFILIKSCFLLSRREVAITVIASGVGHLLTLFWTMPGLILRTSGTTYSDHLQETYKPHAVLISSLVEYVGISLFVVILGFVIVEERRSRQRAESLSREIESLAAALERSRIARDIHDSLGHALTTLGIQLELVHVMGQRDPVYAAQALSNAQNLACQCLEAVQHAVQNVRNEGKDLTQALENLVEKIRGNHGLAIQTELTLPSLPLQTSHQLFSIVQEGFTNILKHTQATHVCLRSRVIENTLILELEDDGQGFDQTLPYGGYGLKGMYERVYLIGGELKITSVLGKGTQIQVFTPL